MPWIQCYTPVAGSIAASALFAAVPLVAIFVCQAVLRVKAHKAGPLAVLLAFTVAVVCWQMPAKLAALQGAAFGIFPVFYIVATTSPARLRLSLDDPLMSTSNSA